MTVIAAVSLIDGVLLMADSRVTVEQRGRRPYHCDIAQKIIPLNANMALAFSGDVRAAAALAPRLIHHMRRRQRLDAISLLHWLPRFLRKTYRILRAGPVNGLPYREIQFIVAGVVHDRMNVVDRARVAELVSKAMRPEASIQRTWLPNSLMQILMAPPGMRVGIPGTPAGILATMSSPDFAPKYSEPLSCVAIGSGGGAVVEMERTADWLFGSDSDFMAKMGLEQAVQDFVAQRNVESVGGMFPCVKIDRRGLAYIGGTYHFPLYEVALSIEPRTKRWIQENKTTGKKQPLLWPWEIVRSVPRVDQRFDDHRQASEHFNPFRGKKT